MSGRKQAAKGASPGPGLIGVVGLGRMGAAIAGRLLDCGFSVWVTNRSQAKAAPLLASGAQWADSPSELASRVAVAITVVSDDAALAQVVTGREGLLTGAAPGFICVDMSTISPATSAQVASACDSAGVALLRAPVSGGPPLAASGQMSVLLSGPPAAREAVQEMLGAVSNTVFYLGDGEEARVMKLALNMLLGTTVVGLCEALVLGERWGLDWQSMLDIVGSSAVASPFVKYKAPLLAKRDFPPGFSTDLLAKDLGLALSLARETGSDVEVTERASQVVERAIGSGLGEVDSVSLVVFLERLAEGRDAGRPGRAVG